MFQHFMKKTENLPPKTSTYGLELIMIIDLKYIEVRAENRKLTFAAKMMRSILFISHSIGSLS